MSTQCRFCGEAVRPDSMFCPACGQLIGAPVPPFQMAAVKPGPVAPDAVPPQPAPAPAPVPLPAPRTPSTQHVEPQAAEPAASVEPAPPAAPPRPSALVFPDGQRLPLDRMLVLGRSPESGAAERGAVPVRLSDPQRAMSRVHLVVSPAATGVEAHDPGSANGTLLERGGAQYALVAGTPAVLLVDDRLILGDLTLTVA